MRVSFHFVTAVLALSCVAPADGQTPPPASQARPRPAAPATAEPASGQPAQARPATPPVEQAAPPQAPAAAQAPARTPPDGSAPVVRAIELRFPRQGNQSVIEPQTYLYYIQTRGSRPSENVWVPYTEQSVLDDFRRLWNTNFLDDLWIEVNDVPYPNGVVGKHIVFNMEERQRIKIVDYVGTKVLEQTKIDEKLKEKGVTIRLDSFIDPSLVNKVSGIIREMLSEKGHLDGRVTHETKPISGGSKVVHLTFTIDEGPKYKIRDIEFVGNQAVEDGSLARRMKENKEQWFLSFITGRGTYQQEKFEEDAEKVIEYYRDRGYIAARVGQPEVRTLEDTTDGKERYVQLRVPVTEGQRYKVGDFTFDGNTVVKTEALRSLFKNRQGDFYSEKAIRKGLEKAREVYGAGGYFEFTGFPDLKPRDLPSGDEQALAATPVRAAGGEPIVDVTMRMQEGKQYFVNRITFTGNTTTRDNVIRREVRLYEGGVFNTEALKFTVKRLNQLGYFKQLEGDAIKVDKSPNLEGKVDVTLKLEEQNRNQLTFGAGVSQYEGFFGQLAFQTSNFLGRGETFSVGIQAGSRAQNYQLAFTEPFLFDRPITGGIDLYKREVRYISQYTQGAIGGNIVFGFPVRDFTRGFVNYAYETVTVSDLNPFYNDPEIIANNPYLADALLLGDNGRRSISKIVPSLVHNTVDNPIFPTAGRRLTVSMDFAGLGGNVNFLKPRLEGVYYFQQTRRLSLGVRGQFEYIKPYGSTEVIPIFERLFLGGEYSVRGFDIRSIGPRDPRTGLVLGGNKSLLFNAEYLIQIAGPVRLVLFYDAGQVPRFRLDTEGETTSIYEPFRWSEFKTSTGAEVRFFMPVLNVPFRLIFAANPQRAGVLDNNLQPQKSFTFRFAVGSTF
jgi:outer membrane protein insertion porin family